MGNSEHERVLIIGAGPAGLSMAIAFGRAGVEADVFERATELREVGAGLGLQTNAMRALIQIGAADYMLQRSTSVNQEIYDHHGQLVALLPYDEVARQDGVPGVTIMRRTDVQEGLLRAVDRGRLHLGAECVRIEQDAAGATATFADGRQEHGALIVGADGLRSIVRAHIHGDAPPRYSGFTSWRGISTDDPSVLPRDAFRLFIGPGAQFAMFPLFDGTYWSGTLVAPQGEHAPAGGERAECLRRFGDFPAPARHLVETTAEEDITRTDIFDRDPVTPWWRERVVLMGDAAHPTTPFMGQGASMAIEDALTLAEELSVCAPFQNIDSIRLALHRYELRRSKIANETVLKSRHNGEGYKETNERKIKLRSTVMRMMPKGRWRKVCEESIQFHL